MAEDDVCPLTIRLFGTFQVSCYGQPLPPLRSQKGKWLLSLLALRQGKETPRAWITDTLWPDNDRGLASLSTTLSDLRGALGNQAERLITNGRSLRLDLTGAEIDLLQFDTWIARGEVEDIERAIALYRGPLLEDCLETWPLPERERRALAYVAALQTLAVRNLADGNMAGAIHRLRTAIEVDCETESAHRLLMQILSDAGDHAAALRVYTNLQRRLHQQYNATPEEETTALYQQTLSSVRKQTAPRLQMQAAPASSVPMNIPRPLTQLIGRARELRTVCDAILATRLVTLTGMGGVGKTRLATEAAISMASNFVHGVHMVSLDSLTDPELIPQQIGRTLHIENSGNRSWQEAVQEFLHNRQILLVLDNCEHLIAGVAQLVRMLLRECVNLNLLTTSRERLGLTGEVNIPVLPLTVPSRSASLTESQDSPAIRLFCERAKAIRFDFSLSQRNFGSIIQICQELDGLPLALELAATLVETLDVREIATRLDRRFDLLQSGDKTAPRRHQALEAMLLWSYDLLTRAESSLLCRLCVFSGGWMIEAAEFLNRDLNRDLNTDSKRDERTLFTLSRLVSKSLVQTMMTPSGIRYRLLETIRAYGRERLVSLPDWNQIQERHYACYLTLATSAAAELQGRDQVLWQDRLEMEHANLRAALHWATRPGEDPSVALRLVGELWRFWYARGHHAEGRRWLERALQMEGERPDELQFLVMKGLGNLCYASTRFVEARDCFQQCLSLALKTADLMAQANALASVANAQVALCDFDSAHEAFTRALQIFEQVGDLRGSALTVSNLAILVGRSDQNHLRAKEFHLRGLALFRQIDAPHSIAQECSNLVHTLFQLNEIDSARTYLSESLALSRELKSPRLLANCLTQHTTLAVLTGQPERAVVLMMADRTLRKEIDAPFPPDVLGKSQTTEQRLRIELGEARFEACSTQGRNMITQNPELESTKRREELYAYLFGNADSILP